MITRIVGLGNDLLSDDAVGLEVARLVRQKLGHRDDIEFRESPVGGLRVLDDLLGCDRVVLLDAVVSSRLAPGTVGVWRWDEEAETFVPYNEWGVTLPLDDDRCLGRRYHSTHDTDVASSLGLARKLGLPVPSSAFLVGVVVREVFEFGIGLDPAVATGRDRAAELVIRALVAERQRVPA
ncbi:MAG: hydrogenase maturation protease [Fimbriimonadia bacterium]|jgi:hydrogenase maturation protease